ncbi:MAG: response regulator transcription factor [Actinomycetes bacterium]
MCDAVAVRILVVEDDPSISEPLVAGLLRHGFEARHVATGAEAVDAASSVDAVLLDLGLPDIDGVEVCRQVRQTSNVPIIVVSARSDEVERVLLLELGADDYVVKPFGLREVVARIRAVARRTGAGGGPVVAERTELVAGPLRVDLRTHQVFVGDAPVDLTPKEFDLLAHLAADPGAAHSRRDILEEVWDPNWFGSPKTLDVHVASLRKKLGHPEWIQAVRGVGFKLVVDGTTA